MPQKRLPKLLLLSLLALVATMAIGASAAQAKWLLLRNTDSVLHLALETQVLPEELLVQELGLEIYCSGGEGLLLLSLNGNHSVLTGTFTTSLSGCEVVDFPFCTVNSPGQATGLILASGSGTAGMSGNDVVPQFSSENFAEITIEGELCPLAEIEEVVSGSFHLLILDPRFEKLEHLAHLDELELNFGELEADLHSSEASSVLAHLEEETGVPWAISLVGL